MHVYPPHLLTVLIPYLAKTTIHLPVFTLCFKNDLFTVCNKFAMCHPNFIIFSRHMPEEFCNETFTSLSPPNLALHVATVPCNASNNLRACQTQSLSKVIKQYKSVKKRSSRLRANVQSVVNSALTQARSRPCHSLIALSTTRCSRPDHAEIRLCIICYRATFKLVLHLIDCQKISVSNK